MVCNSSTLFEHTCHLGLIHTLRLTKRHVSDMSRQRHMSWHIALMLPRQIGQCLNVFWHVLCHVFSGLQKTCLSKTLPTKIGGLKTTDNLLNPLLRESGIDLGASLSQLLEERRIPWTTYANLVTSPSVHCSRLWNRMQWVLSQCEQFSCTFAVLGYVQGQDSS